MRSRWSKVLLAVVAVIIGIMVISGSALASEKPVVIHVGYENHPGEPFDLGVREWARLLEERSGGTMKLEVFLQVNWGQKMISWIRC